MFKKQNIKMSISLSMTFILVLLSLLIFTSASAANGIITNDAFKLDTSGNPIYSQGGGIFKFGSKWYWYGVKYAEAPVYYANPTAKVSTSTFEAFTCYSSTDLVNWTFERVIADRNTPGFGGTGWVGRCGVAYHAATGKYVLCSQFQGDNGSGLLFATCSTPNGVFTFNRVQTDMPMFTNGGTGDQTIFQDDDGKAYLICSSVSGRSHLYVAPLRSSDFCGVDTATEIYRGTGREGNCMFKYNGKYYFCSSDLHGWNASHCYVMEASNILGPYSAEYVMQGTDSSFCHTSQTGFFVTVRGTSGSFVIFCGDRWADFAGNGLGYNQWCPVTFNGSTPVFNDVSKWNIDAAAGTWSVAQGNNYIHNAEIEADRVVQPTIAGWTSTGTGNSSNLKGKQYSGNFVMEQYSTSAYNGTIKQTITGLPNGTYELKAWVKSSGGQSACNLYAANFGGTTINLPINTAISSWTQKTVSSAINVTNGQCEVGVTSNAAAGKWVNIDNWSLFRVSGGTPTPTPPPNNGIYEAENAVLSGAVVANDRSGYSGTGFADYVNASGDYVEWTVNAASAGSKTLTFRYANGGSTDRPLEIKVNGVVVTSSKSFPSTGGWTNWGTVTMTAALNAGSNTIRATAIGSSGGNIDYLQIN